MAGTRTLDLKFNTLISTTPHPDKTFLEFVIASCFPVLPQRVRRVIIVCKVPKNNQQCKA